MGGLSSLEHDLAGYQSIMVDTMIFVYVLERHARYFSLAKRVLLGIESGRHQGFISAITLTELLTAPAQARDMRAMRDYEIYLLHFPNLTILPLDIQVAREAAQIRADTGLPMPDAAILAAARVAGADAVITNDKRWRAKLDAPEILILDDYLAA